MHGCEPVAPSGENPALPMMIESKHSYEHLKDTFARQSLFEDKTWRLSPEPFPLTARQLSQLEDIGEACYEFYQATERLYRWSAEGHNLLRNGEFYAPWIADYMERGKPPELIDLGRRESTRGTTPVVIRPDLLITNDGFSLTEIDSVPGGVGLTAFLNRLYAETHDNLVGTRDSMLHGFYESLAELKPDKEHPVVAIVVSDEAYTYRPEFLWLTDELQALGYPVHCLHPDDLMPLGDSLCAPVDGNPETVDIIYRFFELFDLAEVSTANAIMEAEAEGQVVVTPPMKSYQEEKLSMALFHHHLLADFWRENLSRTSYRTLKKVIPMSWVVDPVDLPPSGVLHAPPAKGLPIWNWEQLAEASQKERNLVLKVSGFHETAWGARSVILGSDVSRIEWQAGLRQAIQMADTHLHVLQEYHKPKRAKHPVYLYGDLKEQEGRTRLCPYYMVKENQTHLTGALATFCPADKKIIHGMRDAAMLPCQVVE